MVTLEVNNSGEVGCPGVPTGEYDIVMGSAGVRAFATGAKAQKRRRERRKRENERGTRYLALPVRAVNSTPAD